MKKFQIDSALEPSAKTVGEIVADDYRTATVFESHGIDFCCGGQVSLGSVCEKEGLDVAEITKELAAVNKEPLARSKRQASWELPYLMDYIVNVHHSYLRENLTPVTVLAQKTAAVHGGLHPEVKEIGRIFAKIAADLEIHMRVKEEEILFPAIKRVASTSKAGLTPDPKDEETIRESVRSLSQEHEEIGDAIHQIRSLSKDYAIPADACNTFKVTYQKLREFEEDLHKHIHLENNILFLKARQL